ncbi:MAG TPA: hypothetical protein VGY48_15320 [Vicinamibacterales bacterium]|jgi:hypothetical protein|nr:hypothetical protein [Vicinamibacterales bacterium]
MARLSRSAACEILDRAGVPRGGDSDFYVLRSSQVDALLTEAKRVRYRKSKNAPGSTARMFHKYVQKRCR